MAPGCMPSEGTPNAAKNPLALVKVMQLEVRWMASGEVACMVDLTPAVRVEDLRSQVFDRSGVPPNQQRLWLEKGEELPHKGDLYPLLYGSSSATIVEAILLVRSSTPLRPLDDPRNSNRAHFRSLLCLESGPVGNFTKKRKLSNAIYGEVAQFQWCGDKSSSVRDVAVKIMSMEKAHQNDEKEANEWSAHRQRQNLPHPEDALSELGILKYLSQQRDLPRFLLRALAIFTVSSDLWLVTEFADGGDLLDAVMAGNVDKSSARRYTWQLLQGVKYLHEHKIGHRDISLENILLKGGSIRLMDFGNAVQSRSEEGDELRYFFIVGKDIYRAPECYVPDGSIQKVLVPTGALPGDVILHADRYGLYQVRLPADAVPGEVCSADIWGYAAEPADIFACGVCFFCMSYANCTPWKTAELSDEFFNYSYKTGDKGLQNLLRHWGKPLLEEEAMKLLTEMLAADPLGRPCASDCLKSSSLKYFADTLVPLHSEADSLC